MTAFRYEALNADGGAVAGVVEADSTRQARASLRGRGLLPLVVEPVTGVQLQRRVRAGARGPGLAAPQLALLTRQFATLLEAGLTVERALAALVEQSATAAERERLAAVRSDVMAGQGLSAAFAQSGFPELYCALVAAGERAGRLEAVMARLADYLERRQDSRQRVLQALIYPAVVGVVALAVVAALLGYVVPQLVTVFESTRQVLPWPTRALLAASAFVRATWWVWVAAVVAAAATYGWVRRTPQLLEPFQALLLRVPLVGSMLVLGDTARFSSALSILSASGVPILAALEAAAGTVATLPLRRAITSAAGAVAEGAPLSQALRRTVRFPPLLTHLIANGEATGRLDTALDAAARAAESELNGRAGVAMALIEPALIVALGLFVLAIVIAVLLPVVEINQLLAPR